MQYYIQAFKQFADFNGRTDRKGFWMFILFHIIVSLVIVGLDRVMGSGELGAGTLSTIYSLAVFIPGLSISVRRLHDVGKSGWLILVGFIPVIGFFWLLYLFVQESK